MNNKYEDLRVGDVFNWGNSKGMQGLIKLDNEHGVGFGPLSSFEVYCPKDTEIVYVGPLVDLLQKAQKLDQLFENVDRTRKFSKNPFDLVGIIVKFLNENNRLE